MSKERNTHFQEFAKLLIQELQAIRFEGFDKNWNSVDIERREQAIIAQRAYDLACHVGTFTSDCYTSGYIDPTQEVDINSIPDLTEWPDK